VAAGTTDRSWGRLGAFPGIPRGTLPPAAPATGGLGVGPLAVEVPQSVAVGGDGYAAARPAGVNTATVHPRSRPPTVSPPAPDRRALAPDTPNGPQTTYVGFGRQVGE
jgi:hypothetical protein